jgi:hypothetical protein
MVMGIGTLQCLWRSRFGLAAFFVSSETCRIGSRDEWDFMNAVDPAV